MSSNPSAAVDAPVPTAPGNPCRRWLDRAIAIAEPLSIAILFAFLLWKTWLRWSDPLVDFPRDLYAAWRISEGDLLYQNVANWYGPLANLVEGAGFRLFGAGYDTMAWMNIALTTGVLLSLRAVFGTLGNRLSKWLASVVFLTVFAFANYIVIANYNFITPYVAQTTYSFLGLLLVLWGLLKHLKTDLPIWLGVAGAGFAVAYLDKPEATLAAAGALGVYLAVQIVRVKRGGQPVLRWLAAAAAWFGGAFLCLCLPIFLYFWARADIAFAWRATNFVPYSVWSGSIIHSALNSPALQVVAGMEKPWTSFIIEMNATGLLLAICGPIALGTRQWSRTGGVAAWAWAMVAIVPAVACLKWLPFGLWERAPSACVIPVCLITVGCVGWSLRTAWTGRNEFSRSLGMAVVGTAASLMLVRIILNARCSNYGFYLAPLAVLFVIHVVVAELARNGRGSLRPNWLLPAAFSPMVLAGCITLLSDSLTFDGMKTLAVGTGRDRFYTLPPPTHDYGWQLNTMLAAYQEIHPPIKSLTVFPEGIAVNYHLRIPTPLKEMEFQPLSLGYAGIEHIMEELNAHPPEAVFLQSRDLTNYGIPYFGADKASGQDIALWLKDHYISLGSAGASPYNITGHTLDFFVQRNAPNRPVAEPAPAKTK